MSLPKPYYEDSACTLYQGDCLDLLRQMESESVQTCVTSPPYWGLRDYGVAGQIGLEETPDAYVARLVEVFREVRRVLRDDGTLWLNLGDSYATTGKNRTEAQATAKHGLNGGVKSQTAMLKQQPKITAGLKQKDLVGIPWMVAFALRADGWYLRQDIIWAKPNPMPESVTDRCTKSHEYIFLLSKSAKYFYDAEAIKEKATHEGRIVKASGTEAKNGQKGDKGATAAGFTKHDTLVENRNKRSVWTVSTKPFAEAHFATFPPDLITPCILAGAPKGGVVLDPFMGAGTVAYVAKEHGRKAIGCELNPDYIDISMKRLRQEVLL